MVVDENQRANLRARKTVLSEDAMHALKSGRCCLEAEPQLSGLLFYEYKAERTTNIHRYHVQFLNRVSLTPYFPEVSLAFDV